MQIDFNGGRFVAGQGEFNYQAVLDDFPKANIIRIITFNISRNQRQDALLDALKNAKATDVQFITNIPSRMKEYFDSDAGRNMRNSARQNIQAYVTKLNPENFDSAFIPYFNPHNHAKVVGTENIVYIGSANFSNESADNIESGVLIEDKEFIQRLYSEFFDMVKDDSLSYYDEFFSAFRLFIMALNAKFQHHYRKMLSDLYTDYERTKMVVADSVLLDLSDLDDLYRDLDELSSVPWAADDTYDEENENYNTALEEMKARFEEIDIDWLKETISEDGTLYRLVSYDYDSVADDIWEEKYSADAFSEELVNQYMEKVVQDAAEIYSSLHDAFQEEADEFLTQIEKILAALQFALKFTDRWKADKINPEIDNT
jgi:ElaB/YqjD/DUF883 family membrane-anchored ribosome-binding protein